MDRIVRNHVRTDIYGVNHLGVHRGPRHGARREHVAFNVHAAGDTAEFHRGLSRVTYMVSGNVCLHLCAGYSHTEYDHSKRVVESGSSNIDVVIRDHERSGNILWLSRARWGRKQRGDGVNADSRETVWHLHAFDP